MEKIVKTICIVAVFMLILINACYANTQIDMNITENTIDTINQTNTKKQNISTVNTITNNSSATVTSIQESNVEDGLELTNILNILLIVVGVVIILLAIAVLIRLYS